ncbi:MAG: oligosaccharide flippase family protein [Thermoplasmata archaeon]
MLGRKSLLLVAQNLLTGLIGYIGLLYVLRYAGLEPYGVLQFSLSFLGLFSFILDLGFSTANIKRISEGMDFEYAITTYFIIKIILAIIFVVIVISSIEFWELFFGGHFQTPYEEYDFFILIPYYILQSFVVYYQSIFNALTKAAIISVPRIIEATFRNFMYIVTSYFIATSLVNKNEYSLIMALIMVITYSIYVLMFMYYGRNWKFKRPTREHFRKYSQFAIPVSVSVILGAVSANVSNVILQYFWGPYYVGAYSGILTIVAFVNSTAGSLVAFLYPVLSSLHSNNKKGEYSNLILLAEKYISMAILPIIVFMIIFSKQIVNLWTAQLIAFNSILIILSLMAFVNSINSPYSTHFNASGNPKFLMYMSFISFSIIIFFDIIFIPRYFLDRQLFGFSALGAALSNFISALVIMIIIRIYTYREEGIFGNKNILYQIGTGIITGIIIFYLRYFNFPTYPWWSLLIWLVLTFLIFFGISLFLRIISKEDIKYIIEILNPDKMVKYIKEEIKK